MIDLILYLLHSLEVHNQAQNFTPHIPYGVEAIK
jgi:hypothetical protein